jgi:serine/threonine-protein kinase
MEMINGLSYLHRKRIIHRDVKIQNFVIEGSKCKIIDFGLAKRVKYWKSSIE